MKHLIFFFAIALSSVQAQTFKPDAIGYVADPKFHALIKSRGYELVGSFDTIQENPVIVGAKVLKKGAWSYIDRNGKEISSLGTSPFYGSVERKNTNNSPFGPGKVDGAGRGAGNGGGSRFGNDNTGSQPATPSIFSQYSRIKVNGKYGFIDKDSNLVIQPIFDALIPFPEKPELLQVYQGNWRGIYEVTGKVIVPVNYRRIVVLTGSQHHPQTMFLVDSCGKAGVISASGQTTIPFKYENIEISSESIDRLEITLQGKKGITDREGKILIPPMYDRFGHFSQTGNVVASKNGLYGVVSEQGEIIPFIYASIDRHTNEIFRVSLTKENQTTMGLIDLEVGKEILPAIYEKVGFPMDGLSRIDLKTPVGLRYGYADLSGKIVIPAIYEAADENFLKGMTSVKLNGQTSILDTEGKTLVSTHHEALRLLIDNSSYIVQIPYRSRLVFCNQNKCGIMDFEGKIIIPARYKSIDFTKGVYLVQLSKYGILGPQGKQLVPMLYNSLTVYEKGVFNATTNDKSGLVDFYGNVKWR